MKLSHQLLVLLVAILFLSACSGSKETPKSTAELYFQKGEKQFEKDLYDDAIESWEKVRDTFYSPALSMLAELKIAEAYYASERYAEAASTFSNFIAEHPNDFRAASVYYRMGLSYYQLILSPDRDQSRTQNALLSFQEFINRFPNDPKVQEAKYLIQRCRTRLAEHEVYVGHFYLKRKKYESAITRLEGILKSFPDYYYRDEAYFYLGNAYLKIKQRDKATTILNKLLDEFPGSDFADDTNDLLAEK